MNIYYCWVTAMLPSYQDGIIAGMARKGYMVGPAAKDGSVAVVLSEDQPAVLFAISVYKATETSADQIYQDMVDVISEMGAHVYSVVISLSSEATWAGPNFKLPTKVSPPPIPTDKSMN